MKTAEERRKTAEANRFSVVQDKIDSATARGLFECHSEMDYTQNEIAERLGYSTEIYKKDPNKVTYKISW